MQAHTDPKANNKTKLQWQGVFGIHQFIEKNGRRALYTQTQSLTVRQMMLACLM